MSCHCLTKHEKSPLTLMRTNLHDLSSSRKEQRWKKRRHEARQKDRWPKQVAKWSKQRRSFHCSYLANQNWKLRMADQTGLMDSGKKRQCWILVRHSHCLRMCATPPASCWRTWSRHKHHKPLDNQLHRTLSMIHCKACQSQWLVRKCL
jgi:hypothetical protein